MDHMVCINKQIRGILALLVAGCLGCLTACRTPETGLSGSEGSDVSQMIPFGPPQGVSVTTNGLRQVVLTWSESGSQAYRYRIERALLPEGPFEQIAEVSPRDEKYIDGATSALWLKDQTAYYYRLVAVLEKNGPVSNPSSVLQAMTAPPPEVPQEVLAKATGSREVMVTWQASPSEGVVGYRVERALATEPAVYEPLTDRVVATTFVDGGTPTSTLKDSSDYLYRVIAVNCVSAESACSQPATVHTLPPPKPVKGLTAVSREVRCVPLKWEESPEEDVLRYDVFQARDPEGPFEKIDAVQGRSVTHYTVGGGNPGHLEDEGTYYFLVRAVNDVTAESADSVMVKAVTREVPPEIKEVQAVSARPREMPLSWQASPDNSVVGYEIWRATAEGDDWTQVGRTTAREASNFLDRGGEKDATQLGLLLDGTVYQYRVVAFNTAGVRSSASVAITGKTKEVPIAPLGLATTTHLPYAVRLTWQANPEPDVNGYLVEASKNPDSGFHKLTELRLAQGGVLAADELSLDPGEIRYYRIKALDREGLESVWSAVLKGQAKPLPDAPTELQGHADGSALKITWQPPSQTDVISYNVWEAKFLFGWRLLGSTPNPVFRITCEPGEKFPKLSVTAIDKDKLESQHSKTLNLNQ